MSATTLRYHNLTLSFLPTRRDRKVLNRLRTLRLYTSRRRMKQICRHYISA